MPRLKIPPSELQNREIVARIHYGMMMRQVTHEELALAARITKPTLYQRYKHPEDFKLSELRGISRKLNIPLGCLIGIQTMPDKKESVS